MCNLSSEYSAHSPRRESNLYLWDTRPSWFIKPREQARLVSVRTNTSDTHPPAPSWNTGTHYKTLQTPICRTVTAIRPLRGPSLSWKRRVRGRRADGVREKVPILLDGIRTCASGIRTHHASDYNTRAGTPGCVCVCIYFKNSLALIAQI